MDPSEDHEGGCVWTLKNLCLRQEMHYAGYRQDQPPFTFPTKEVVIRLKHDNL
jgi:hypothetical protein